LFILSHFYGVLVKSYRVFEGLFNSNWKRTKGRNGGMSWERIDEVRLTKDGKMYKKGIKKFANKDFYEVIMIVIFRSCGNVKFCALSLGRTC